MQTANILNICRSSGLALLFQCGMQSADCGVQNAEPLEATGKSQDSSGVATNRDYWAIEDAKERERLPLYKIIPAARPDELTPSNGYPKPETFRTWHRSHGDNGGMRYSALNQINLRNVTNLQQAWIYHSGDGSNNLQCNRIVMRDIMMAPTPAK